MNNTKINNRGSIKTAIVLLLLFNLIFLFYVKYTNQNLPLSKINLLYIGNLFDIISSLLLLIAIIIYFNKKEVNGIYLLCLYTILSTTFLILGFLTTIIKLPLPNFYLLDHPIDSFISGLFFTIFQFLEFFIFFNVLFKIINKNKLISLRSIVNSIILMIAIFLFAFYFLHINIGVEKNSIIRAPNTVAVVLGAAVWSNNNPSPTLASRLDKANELYISGRVNKIQLTGSNAPGEMSEAKVALNYLMDKGINKDDIWIEENTTSTTEQIQYIRQNVLNKKFVDKIVIISDSYHLTRVQEICNFHNFSPMLIASDLQLSFKNKIYYKIRESIALVVFWFFAL